MEIHIVPLTGEPDQDHVSLNGAAMQGFQVAATYSDAAGKWYCIAEAYLTRSSPPAPPS